MSILPMRMLLDLELMYLDDYDSRLDYSDLESDCSNSNNSDWESSCTSRCYSDNYESL